MKNDKLSKIKDEKMNLKPNSSKNNKLNINPKLNKDTNKIKKSNNNNYGFDIYDKKNAQEFNRQFLGLGNANNSNGIFAGEGIFNMDLPMHKPGEVPDFSNPYGNNFFSKNKDKNIKLNPRTQPLEYLQNFFGGFGIEFPVKELMNPPQINKNINKNNNNKMNKNKTISAPKILKKSNIDKNGINKKNNKIKVQQHEFDKNIFDTNYISNNEDIFNENYCSNFRSNLEKEAFDYLLSLIKGNRVLPWQQKQIPIKTDIFNLLNQFDMTEKYMKKNLNSFEAPFCSICLQNINIKQRCILLPCGHLYHFKCLKIRLGKNCVCPMCRFDLNDYFNHKRNVNLNHKFK